MNFKKVYKEANDSIKGDRSILYNLGEKENKKKVIALKKVYTFAGCAAALVIVCAVTALPEHLMSDKDLYDTAVQGVSGKITAESVDLTEAGLEAASDAESKDMLKTEQDEERLLENENSESASAVKNTYDYKKDITADKETESLSINSESFEGAEKKVSEESENAVMSASVFSVRAMNEDADRAAEENGAMTEYENNKASENISNDDIPPGAVGSGSSGGGAVRSSRAASDEVESVSVEKLFDAARIDKDNLKLEGFELEIPQNAEVIISDDGSYSYRACLYLYDGEEKSINLTISTKGEKENFSILNSGNIVSALYETLDKKIEISAVNVSEEEISGYINKIK